MHAIIKQTSAVFYSNYSLSFFPCRYIPVGLFSWFLQTTWHRLAGNSMYLLLPSKRIQRDLMSAHWLALHWMLPESSCSFPIRICLHVILMHLCMWFQGFWRERWRGGGAGWRHSSSVRSSKQIELKAVLSGAAELLWWYVSDSARSWAWVSYGCQGVLSFPCNSSFLGRGGPSVTVDHLPLQPWIWSTRCWALGVPNLSPSIVHFHDSLYVMFQ